MMTISGIDWASKIPHGGTHTVTAGEASANAAVIDTGKVSAVGQIVQVLRSGADVTVDATISMASGVLTVADGGATYNVSAGDVINWIVF